MDMGTITQTAEAPQAHLCLPPLRNGALARIIHECVPEALPGMREGEPEAYPA